MLYDLNYMLYDLNYLIFYAMAKMYINIKIK